MNEMYLVLGDWSDDGHGKSRKELYLVNKSVLEVQEAYKASCKLTGIAFNHNENYTGIKRDWKEEKDYQICTEYEGFQVSAFVMEVLEKFDCPLYEDLKEDDGWVGDLFEDLWWWFVGLSLEGLEYSRKNDNIPCINGYWNDNLNTQFGYGLFS